MPGQGSSSVPAAVERLSRAALAAAEPAGYTSVCASRVLANRSRGVLWASDARARRLDDLQVVLGEGPGVSALVEGGPVMVHDVGAHWRQGWVAFNGAASHLGVRSVCAFPLQIGAVRMGTLTLHGSEPAILDASQLGHQLTLCDDLGVALLVADSRSGDWSEVLDAALDQPLAVTAQAAGMVMAQLNGTIAEAMERLCAHAFTEDLSLEEVSRSVVNREFRFEPDRFYPDPDLDEPQPRTGT
jgi:GAF domain-containing protein